MHNERGFAAGPHRCRPQDRGDRPVSAHSAVRNSGATGSVCGSV